MALLDRYQREIQRSAPVVYEGLTFHPLLVEDYPIFNAGRQAYELMLSSLKDPKLARLNWCACLWELDRRCEEQTGTRGCFLEVALYVMATALRLNAGYDGSYPMRPVFAQDGSLSAIMLGDPRDCGLLNMMQMDDVRQIIAAQNGYEIPDENWNPELVQAAQENAKRNAPNVDYDFETLVYSVAYQCHVRAEEVYGWSIREFEKMQEAVDRDINYRLCAAVEMSGDVKFTKGNPYPSWKFNRKPDAMPAGFRTIADIDASAKGLIAGT